MNPTLVIIRGLSGSGKTRMANLLVNGQEDRTDICVDDFYTDNGVYSFDPERLKEAHEWCKKETQGLLEENWQVVVVHNTFSRKWEVDPYFEMAERFGYDVQVINLYDAGLNDKQLSERCLHGISAPAISRQRKRWEKDVFRERVHHNHQPYPYPYPPMYYPPHQMNPHQMNHNPRPHSRDYKY